MVNSLSWRSDGPEDAPPLVLLNSVGTSTAMWSPCVAPLAEQFRVIRIDHRGHGDSPPAPAGSASSIDDHAADVLAALDEIGVDRVGLAGLSLGGMVGMWLAIHAPERISRLALVCTSAYLPPAEFWLNRAASVRTGGMASIADAVIARWITPEVAERDEALMAALHDMFIAVDAESYAQGCEAIAGMDLRDDLARIAAPTLVIAGEQDPATPPEHARTISDAVPGSRLEILDQASHVLTYEQPGRLAVRLLEHFRGGAALASGYAVRRAVLGDSYVDTALASTSDLTEGFQTFLTRYAWGEVWTRPGLSRRERSIATLGALVTLGAEHELAAHIRGAVRNGLSPTEVVEVLQHLAIYAGLPRANRAVAIARDVLDAGEAGKPTP
jgi:3-oxoadipate enol-lactonase/4-carboxymuconolactone decarboxylase